MSSAPSKKKIHTRGELTVYLAVFAFSAVFLVALASSVTDMETRGNSWNNLNGQAIAVSNAVQQLVFRSESVDMENGMATSTLRLRMASSTMDPTTVYASGTAVYLAQGKSNAPVALTDAKVVVNRFMVTKYEDPNGSPFVQLDLAISYDSPAPSVRRSCSVQSSVSRVSVARVASTTPASLINTFKIGGIDAPWYSNLFFEMQGWKINGR